MSGRDSQSPSLPNDDVPVPPVYQRFVLLTAGKDTELDVLNIAVESFKQLDGDQIGRILEYLTKRYTRPF